MLWKLINMINTKQKRLINFSLFFILLYSWYKYLVISVPYKLILFFIQYRSLELDIISSRMSSWSELMLFKSDLILNNWYDINQDMIINNAIMIQNW